MERVILFKSIRFSKYLYDLGLEKNKFQLIYEPKEIVELLVPYGSNIASYVINLTMTIVQTKDNDLIVNLLLEDNSYKNRTITNFVENIISWFNSEFDELIYMCELRYKSHKLNIYTTSSDNTSWKLKNYTSDGTLLSVVNKYHTTEWGDCEADTWQPMKEDEFIIFQR